MRFTMHITMDITMQILRMQYSTPWLRSDIFS
jgi:hypothetical protein